MVYYRAVVVSLLLSFPLFGSIADLNCDNVVDIYDFHLFTQNWLIEEEKDPIGEPCFQSYYLDSNHVWHVSVQGNDLNPGHAQQFPVNLISDAKRNINSAMSNAVSGDTIIIHPGTYNEALLVSKSLRLVGFGQGVTVVQTNHTGYCIRLNVSNCSLKDVSFINTGTSSFSYGIYMGNATENNRVENCLGQGNWDGIHMGINSDNHSVINSHGLGRFDGIQAGSGANKRVINCIAETTGENPISAEVNAFVCTSAVGLVVENLICKARRITNDYDLYGCYIKGDALLNDVTIDVEHNGTGTYEASGLRVSGVGSCLANNVKVTISDSAGTDTSVHVESNGVLQLCNGLYDPNIVSGAILPCN